MAGTKDGKPSSTEVNKIRTYLIGQGVPAAQAALMAVMSKTRAQISMALIEWLSTRPKKS